MFPVPGFYRAQDMDGGDVGAGESAIVHDLLNAGSGRGDLRRQIGQTSRPIANNGGEPAKATIGHQAAFDNATQDVRINIPSAQEENNALPGQFG